MLPWLDTGKISQHCMTTDMQRRGTHCKPANRHCKSSIHDQAYMITGRMTTLVATAAYDEPSPLGELSCSALPEPFLLGGVRGLSRARAFAASSSCLCSSSNLSISEEKTVMRLCQLTSPGPTTAKVRRPLAQSLQAEIDGRSDF